MFSLFRKKPHSNSAPISEMLLSDINDKTPEQPRLVDEASATVTYVGYAEEGELTSAASWEIMRVSVTGTITAIEYAVAKGNRTNIWDNRAALTYI